MKLIVTGGGTGGHVYPALEVARLAAERGAELRYFGSLRGMEGEACRAREISFQGFPSAPLYSLKTPRGWQGLLGLVRASAMATLAMRKSPPDVVFSSGGYSAAPVLWAARRLKIPMVLLASDSVPGRTTRMFIPTAHAFAFVFRHSDRFTFGGRGVHTGQPVREALRRAAQSRQPDEEPLVLVVGGSQGSAFLNENVPKAAVDLPGVRFLHATGRAHFEVVSNAIAPLELGDRYRLVPYLEQEELMDAYRRATLAVARSGGTLAELAVFRLPSVLVPLPQSADDHQRLNALEFAAMNAATVCEQPSPDLAAQIRAWLDDAPARQRAAEAMAEWDVPDATARLVGLIEEAAR
ncbi:MAG: UDP-N-acetylglucosamine--N-acetylmuramyl-(pentapeptide) pyrophosphoryl-undecaprenol N-acetylglucosamine transferase [Fimbriimonas sp.]